jgi:hypothetical protein
MGGKGLLVAFDMAQRTGLVTCMLIECTAAPLRLGDLDRKAKPVEDGQAGVKGFKIKELGCAAGKELDQ